LQYLFIESSITVGAVGSDFLNSHSNIMSVKMPATSLGDNCFANCANLTVVNFPNATTIGENFCYGCSVLSIVEVPMAETFGGSAFYDCNSLGDIDLSMAVTFGNFAFYHCDNLSEVLLPAATTFADYAFGYCIGLNFINLGLAETFGDYAFEYCNALTSVTLPAATTFGDAAFVQCDALASISLPAATTFGDSAFMNCDSISNISLPATTSFGGFLFTGCPNKITLILGSTIPAYTAETFKDYLAESLGAIAIVPADMVATYDNEDSVMDGMWYGFTIKASTNTVTFNSNGGSTVSSQTVNYGNKATEPIEPTKTGYIFNGWYSDSETTNLWDFATDTVTANTTLYADWIVDNSGGATPSEQTTQYGNIYLTITDSNGNPLAYYPVELHSTVVTGTTDANGQVTFSNVAIEDHELVVFDKEGNELGTIYLTMTEADTNSTSINGNTVGINFNESAVSIDIEIFVEDNGSLSVQEVEINANPKTGATETALYIGEGSEQVNVMPYLAILATLALIGGTFIIRRKQVE
jgi:uncharacterized repeat protein (TIGR02543 family)